MTKTLRVACFGVFALIIAVILVSQVKLANGPLRDNDEGVYATTLALVEHGHPAYKDTFLSQPPAFLITVYPGYLLLGKSLPAARLTVGLYSLLGLLAMLLIGIELDNLPAALLAIGILYWLPYFANQTYYFQTVTLQSDALAVAFSLVSLASFMRFTSRRSVAWLSVSALFFNLAFWTKFDFFLVPCFAVGLWQLVSYKHVAVREILRAILIFSIVSAAFFLVLVVPFGLEDIYKNVVALRLGATNVFPPVMSLNNYLMNSLPLAILAALAVILMLATRDRFRSPLFPMFAWVLTAFVFAYFYRPLFPHHLIMVIVPLTVFCSFAAGALFTRSTVVYPVIALAVAVVSITHYLVDTAGTPARIVDTQQQQVINLIDSVTKPGDAIVTDEGVLSSVSGRLPPPILSDLSYARILSGNLSPETFQEAVKEYRPVLIIPWNGRLRALRDLDTVLQDYRVLTTIDGKEIYIRAN